MTKLTPASARDLKPGRKIFDHEVKGLHLCAFTESKAFYLHYKTRTGRRRNPKLGSFPELSLSKAREVAKGLKERVARGEDPQADWKAASGVPTLSALCDRVLTEWAEPRVKVKQLKPSTLHLYRQLIETHIKPGLGHLRIDEIDTPDVDRLLTDVFNRKYVHKDHRTKTAETQACHVRRTLWRVFTLAKVHFKLEGIGNPVEGSIPYREGRRRRRASPEELAAIWAALENLALKWPQRAACIWTLFLTGGRVSEIVYARAGQLLRKAGDRWVLVLEQHKTDRHVGEREIVIPDVAVEILKRIAFRDNERIFGDVTLHAMQGTWRKVRKESGCDGLLLMDARRTFASYAISIGKSLEHVGDLLGHTKAETTKGYTYMIEELRQASANDIANEIAKRAKG
jgi:integrase